MSGLGADPSIRELPLQASEGCRVGGKQIRAPSRRYLSDVCCHGVTWQLSCSQKPTAVTAVTGNLQASVHRPSSPNREAPCRPGPGHSRPRGGSTRSSARWDGTSARRGSRTPQPMARQRAEPAGLETRNESLEPAEWRSSRRRQGKAEKRVVVNGLAALTRTPDPTLDILARSYQYGKTGSCLCRIASHNTAERPSQDGQVVFWDAGFLSSN